MALRIVHRIAGRMMRLAQFLERRLGFTQTCRLRLEFNAEPLDVANATLA